MPVDEAIQIKGNSILGFSEAIGGTESVKAIDPSTGNEIEPLYQPTSAEVETAATLAQTTFLSYLRRVAPNEPSSSTKSPPKSKRSAILSLRERCKRPVCLKLGSRGNGKNHWPAAAFR